MSEWTRFNEKQPTEEGVYEWRIPSACLSGMVVTFQAWMHPRNTVSTQVLAPAFSGWDGWRLTLPTDISWKALPVQPQIEIHDYAAIGIEGIDFSQCPYCCKKPTLHGWLHANGGGIIVAAAPWKYNRWRLQCCAWGKTPTLRDPREIEKIRRDAFAKMKGSRVWAKSLRSKKK